MNKFKRDPVTNPPPEGYWQNLNSVSLTPIIHSLFNLMKADTEFQYVSTYFDGQVLSISSEQFPTVLAYFEDGVVSPLAIKSFTNSPILVVEYYAHHQLKRFSEEMYWFLEQILQLVITNRQLDGTVNCVQKVTPQNYEFDWAVQEDFIIDLVRVRFTVDFTISARIGGN